MSSTSEPRHVRFASGALQLEGVLTISGAAARGVVVCHPHPQYGGDMDNPVVVAAADALAACGYATLRFNYRGVGRSEGAYGGGAGEADDTRAAIRFLMEQTGSQRVCLAGYSFGAMLALQVGPATPGVDCVIALAPPLAFFSLDGLSEGTTAMVFVVGDRDQYCSVAQLTRQFEQLPEPKVLEVIPGADHFFAGYESAIAAVMRESQPRLHGRAK